MSQIKNGFDIIIVVSSNNNSKYWNWRLSKTRNQILPKKTKIICIEEDWKNKEGAGQLLGTLNAIKKSQNKINIKKALKNKKSIAIYHTAGKGKRMAPLCGKEKNNKPAIKLPRPVKIDGKNNLFSILEMVIFSTQIFAKSRKGRVCVFWGDQIIIPQKNINLKKDYPIEIFGIKYNIKLTEKDWEENWKRYGILIPQKKETAIHREKLSYDEIKKIKKERKLKENKKGEISLLKSLGYFSLSFDFLEILLSEFKKELEEKKLKLDVEPDLWEPLTSSKEEFIKRNERGEKYFERIQKLKNNFKKLTNKELLIFAFDFGKKTIYWDYGNLRSYFKNIIKINQKSKEGEIARRFFKVEKYYDREKNNLILNSKVNGEFEGCVILNSQIKNANIKNSIIINSKIKELKGKENLLYYVREKNKLWLLPEEIITDIKIKENEIVRMKTKLSRDGKEDWKIKLPDNPFSYSELEKLVSKIEI